VTRYVPVMEDWMFHVVLPFAAYAAIAAAALTLRRHATGSLFVIASMTLALLFIGIHNAWDTVTFLVVGATGTGSASAAAERPAEGPPAPSVNAAAAGVGE
jgi:hypothetical protein